jgi:hypothetical protein
MQFAKYIPVGQSYSDVESIGFGWTENEVPPSVRLD